MVLSLPRPDNFLFRISRFLFLGGADILQNKDSWVDGQVVFLKSPVMPRPPGGGPAPTAFARSTSAASAIWPSPARGHHRRGCTFRHFDCSDTPGLTETSRRLSKNHGFPRSGHSRHPCAPRRGDRPASGRASQAAVDRKQHAHKTRRSRGGFPRRDADVHRVQASRGHHPQRLSPPTPPGLTRPAARPRAGWRRARRLTLRPPGDTIGGRLLGFASACR